MSILNPKSVINRTLGSGLAQTVESVANPAQGLIGNSVRGSGLIGGIGNVISNEVGSLLGGLLGFSGLSTIDSLVRLSFKPGHPYAGYPGIMSPLSQTGGMIFPYRPTVDISRTVNYETVTPIHSMQDYKSFRNNSAATISISGQYAAQTVEEARYLQAVIHFIRTASMMSFGIGSAVPAGMPPPVLNLSAYGPNNLNRVPVIIDAVTTAYPNDVDYVRVDGNDIPTLMTVTVPCSVQLSPSQLRNFNLDAFASGNTQGYV